jgi:hypothetical protein
MERMEKSELCKRYGDGGSIQKGTTYVKSPWEEGVGRNAEYSNS